MEANNDNDTNLSRNNLTNEGSGISTLLLLLANSNFKISFVADNMSDEAIQVTWVHKLLVFLAVANAIGNTIYVSYEFYKINSKVSNSRNNYSSQHTSQETDAIIFDNRTENLVWFVQVY